MSLLKYNDFINEGLYKKLKKNIYNIGNKYGYNEQEIDRKIKQSIKKVSIPKALAIGVISYGLYKIIKGLINKFKTLEKQEADLKIKIINTPDLKEKERLIKELKQVQLKLKIIRTKAKNEKEKYKKK